MSENTKWTPGPWALDERFEGSLYILPEADVGKGAGYSFVNRREHRAKFFRKVAHLEGKPYQFDGISVAEHLANARLMSAAPELYAAVIAGLNLFAKGHALDNFNWGASSLTAENIRELNELPCVFRAALAKARGDLPKPPDGGAEPITNEAKSRGEA